MERSSGGFVYKKNVNQYASRLFMQCIIMHTHNVTCMPYIEFILCSYIVIGL